MPTIKRKPIRERQVPYKHDSRSSDFYNSMAWRRLRDTLLSLHPLCQCCLEHDRVVPATCVHHLTPFLRGDSEEERWNLFLDENNCWCICDTCHLALHNKDREYHLGRLDDLTEVEYNYVHGLNYS